MNKINKVYIYDGTLEGLLTITYDSIKNNKAPSNIIKEGFNIINLFDTYEYIETDLCKSERLFKSIREKISDEALYNIYNSFLSNKKDKELSIFYYIVNGFKHGNKINNYRNLNCVVKVQTYCKITKREVHRLKGFIRFKSINNILYSEISPDNDVLELLVPHFKNRLKNEIWIIEDIKRKKAVIYNKKSYKLFDTTDFNIKSASLDNDEVKFQNLWKEFIKSITIKERKNLKCQLNFMPKRYWKYMSETEV